MTASALPPLALETRIAALDWPALAADLAARGHAITPPLLTPTEYAALIALYSDDTRFRRRIDMARYRFGEGDYGYFNEPLPPLVADLRERLYARLAPLANGMMTDLRRPDRFPANLADYRAHCHAAGQTRPTPLLLRYRVGGYNCLHRDLYGPLHFPLQCTLMLSRPGVDYAGGEFLLVENRARQQSIGSAMVAAQGACLLFPVYERPVPGKRGPVRAEMRHGVSRITAGERYALGILFHDAA